MKYEGNGTETLERVWDKISRPSFSSQDKAKFQKKFNNFYSDLSLEQLKFLIRKTKEMDMSNMMKGDLETAKRLAEIAYSKAGVSEEEKGSVISECLFVLWKVMCNDTLPLDINKFAAKVLGSFYKNNRIVVVEDLQTRRLKLEFDEVTIKEAIENIVQNRHNLASIK